MQKVRVDLKCRDCENYIHKVLLVSGDKKDIIKVLNNTRPLIDEWLNNDGNSYIPDEYDWCTCDEDFYVQSLENNFEVEELVFNDCLLYEF